MFIRSIIMLDCKSDLSSGPHSLKIPLAAHISPLAGGDKVFRSVCGHGAGCRRIQRQREH
jgi:hypothetical protein